MMFGPMLALFAPFFERVQETALASAIAGSSILTGVLSASHLIGFTLVLGGALVSNLKLIGLLFPGRDTLEVTVPATRGIAAGLLISLTTGLLLFSARAADASANQIFQIKMMLLASAAVLQFTLVGRMSRTRPANSPSLRLTGGMSLALWFGVALAGCGFILLE
jgi:hypothetical protein